MLTQKPARKKIMVSYHCFQTDRGWGYDIMMNRDTIIHQPFIPAEAGYNGFQTKEQAATVARFVIEKIKSHEIPSVSHQQLQQLGVLPTQSK